MNSYWTNAETFSEAKKKVLIGDFEKTTEAHLELLKELNIKNTDIVLDFGCGIGRLTQPISKQCNQIIGADISDDMILHATNYCKEDNITFKMLRNNDGLELMNNYFDKAYSLIVLQHLDKITAFQVLLNINYSLKKGGQMLIQFPNLEKLEQMFKSSLIFRPMFGGTNPIMEFYSKKELEYIFELLKMDYRIIEHNTDFYVLATKKEDINFQEYLIGVNKWKK